MALQHQLHMCAEHFLYAADGLHSGVTRRASATLLIAIGAHPLVLGLPSGQTLTMFAGYVAPDVARSLTCEGAFVSLNVDPGTAAFRRLRWAFPGAGVLRLDQRAFDGQRDRLEGALLGQLHPDDAESLGHALVQAATGSARLLFCLDRRVRDVASQVRSSAACPTLSELAARAHLSADRLTHLFSLETGTSIRQFALWAKMRRAAHSLVGGHKLTDVALRAGFADLAHMSRTFGRLFGLPPSFIADRRRVSILLGAGARQDWAARTG